MLVTLVLVVCLVRRKCNREVIDLDSESISEYEAVVMRDFKSD